MPQLYKEKVSGNKSDDTRKFVFERKEPRRHDPTRLGVQLYKVIAPSSAFRSHGNALISFAYFRRLSVQAITEQKWTLRVALYEAVDMSLSNTGLFGQEVRPEATLTCKAFQAGDLGAAIADDGAPNLNRGRCSS